MANKNFQVRHGLNVNTNIIATNGTSVGIGTDNPSFVLDVANTGAVRIAAGNTGQRPSSPANGIIRYNSELTVFEGYANNAWDMIGIRVYDTANTRIYP